MRRRDLNAGRSKRMSRSRFVPCLSQIKTRTSVCPVTHTSLPHDLPLLITDGYQGRFYLLLHLRVCQRGSPRQARGPGTPRVAPSPGASPTAVSPADRAKEFFSAEPASDGNLGLRSPRPETATTTHVRRIQRPFRTRSDLAPTPRPPHRRSPMPSSTRASPRTPTPRCVSDLLRSRRVLAETFLIFSRRRSGDAPSHGHAGVF